MQKIVLVVNEKSLEWPQNPSINKIQITIFHFTVSLVIKCCSWSEENVNYRKKLIFGEGDENFRRDFVETTYCYSQLFQILDD